MLLLKQQEQNIYLSQVLKLSLLLALVVQLAWDVENLLLKCKQPCRVKSSVSIQIKKLHSTKAVLPNHQPIMDSQLLMLSRTDLSSLILPTKLVNGGRLHSREVNSGSGK